MSNTSPTAPYRSAGRPEAMFIMERLIDLAARQHGFDRLELRRRNLIPPRAMPFPTALGLTYDSGEFAEAMDKALALADWPGFPSVAGEAQEARTPARLRLCQLYRGDQRLSDGTLGNHGVRQRHSSTW